MAPSIAVRLSTPDLRALVTGRVERALEAALARATAPSCPPTLASALRHAVFPGGARLRPQLCLAAALGVGDAIPPLADAAAAAIELLHCASLVHDDLPCFDDADTRRGRPSVHRAFGEAMAVLVGDALIVHAFDTVITAAREAPDRGAELLGVLVTAASSTRGIVAGQAWESEDQAGASLAAVEEYHRAKTAALFEAAATMGALAGAPDSAGCSPQTAEAWGQFGDAIGRAYQAADDLLDATATTASLGKPAGRDAALGRPSVVRTLGVAAARARVTLRIERALAAVPPSPVEEALRAWVRALAARLRAG